MTSLLASPPTAPGSLTAPARSGAVLAYLSELGHWRDDLRAALATLDRRAQVAAHADAYTGDLTLALSLLESIDRRTTELEKAWDGGRVGPTELAHIAELSWSRLPDALGNPSAFSLNEATTLASALEARLAARLDADTIAGSGAADRIAPLRDTLDRCRQLAATLGRRAGEADALAAELDATLAGSDGGPSALGAEVRRIADAAERLERDLIKETSLRQSVERDTGRLAARIAELTTVEAEVHEVADRCRAKIAGAPRLAVPDVAALGPVPTLPDGNDEPGTWTAARAKLDAYRARVDQVSAALTEAQRRFSAPLDERAELRGLAEAYRAKAAGAGRAEDAVLEGAFEAARAVLWSAPCDLVGARALVTAYQQAVLAAAGAPADRPEPLVPTGKPAPRSIEEDR